jgi:hypothetical protein
MIQGFENVDLDHQKDLADKKLSLMRLGQRFINGGNLAQDDLKAKKDSESKISSGKKSGTAMAVRDE